MSIDEYIHDIEALIHSSPIAASYNLNIDRKTDHIAFLSGKVDFRDDSTLDFKEFIESTKTGIEKYNYGYNYRKESEVIFRYDNAPDPRARHLPSFPHHKHTASGQLVGSEPKALSEILEEVINYVVDTRNI